MTDLGDHIAGEVAAGARFVLRHLNQTCNKNFRELYDNLSWPIKKLQSGYKVEDLIIVINYKANDPWFISNEQFLRPSTLFGDSFASYLDCAERNQPYGKQTTNDNKNVTVLKDYLKSIGEAMSNVDTILGKINVNDGTGEKLKAMSLVKIMELHQKLEDAVRKLPNRTMVDLGGKVARVQLAAYQELLATAHELEDEQKRWAKEDGERSS